MRYLLHPKAFWRSLPPEDQALCQLGFRQGMADVRPTVLATLIWAIVTAVAMLAAGLPAWLVVFTNLMVYAASAQLAVLSMLLSHAPVLFIWAAAFVVNLRFIIFSASLKSFFRFLPLGPRLLFGFLNGDMVTLLFLKRFQGAEAVTPKPQYCAYFIGTATFNYLVWQVGVVIGVVFARWIPLNWGLELAGGLTLLILIMKSIEHWAAIIGCVVAALTAVYFQFLPNKLWVFVAVVAGVGVALVVERLFPNAWLKKPA